MFNDDNTAHAHTHTSARTCTGGVAVDSEGPLFYPDRQYKAPEPLLLHPTQHQSSPPTRQGKLDLNEAEIVHVRVCAEVHRHQERKKKSGCDLGMQRFTRS